MLSTALTAMERLKISCLTNGIRVTPQAEEMLSQGGKVPLTIREYATTGGVTLELEQDIFVNAPFAEWYTTRAEASLELDPVNGNLYVAFEGQVYAARALPLPGYLGRQDSQGRPVQATTMSHADRVRLSPIFGCSFSCRFCDFVGKKYVRRPAEQVLEGLQVAQQDAVLPVKHVLISGGTPSARDYGYLDDIFERVIRTAGMPVDVMLAPRKNDIVDRLAAWGVHGYSINIEVFDEQIAAEIAPQKHRLGHKQYAQSISRAVENVGSTGRVRSLILVGLEPEESTLAGVEFLARLGCDPTLSPFRPGSGTPLENTPPPSQEMLERVYLRSREIVERFGVKLGPRCIPCQHNTLTLPDGSSGYYYS